MKSLAFSAAIVAITIAPALAVDKAASGTNLADAASWAGAIAPIGGDGTNNPTTAAQVNWVADSSNGGHTVDNAVSWGSLNFTDADAAVSVTGSDITLSGGGQFTNHVRTGAQNVIIANNFIGRQEDPAGTLAAPNVPGNPGRLTFSVAGTGGLTLAGNITQTTDFGGGGGDDLSVFLRGTGTGEGTVDGNITVNHALVKTDSSRWVVNGNISAEFIRVENGVLIFASPSSLIGGTVGGASTSNFFVGVGNPATAAFRVGGAGEFTAEDIQTIAALGTGTGGFLPGSRVGFDTTNANGGNFIYGNVLANTNAAANSIGLHKLGNGTLTLTAANTYTGTTLVTSGTLTVSGTGTFGAEKSPITVAGGVLDLNAASHLPGAMTFTGGITQNGMLDATSFAATAGSPAVSAKLTGSSALTLSGGTLTLSGDNNFSGGVNLTTATAATLAIDHDHALGTGLLSVSSFNKTIRAADSTARTVANNINIKNSPAALGSADTGNLLFTGGVDLSAADRTFKIANERTEFSGVMSNSGATIVKTGIGTLILSGANTFTSAVDINAGTLLANSSTATGSGLVTVNNTATLGGTGTVGAVTVKSGGSISPGDSVGSLTAAAVTLENNARIGWEISNWNGSAGTGYDTLNLTSLIVSSAAPTPTVIVVSQSSLVNFSETSRTFTLVTTTGGISGLDPGDITVDTTNAPGSGTWSVRQNGNVLELVYFADSAYDTFEEAYGISGAGADTDSDFDGIANGIEFVIGGDPTSPESSVLLPTVETTATDLVVRFRRTDASVTINPFVEYGSSLAGWTTATHGVNGVTVVVENDFHGTGIDRVTVSIPRNLAIGAKLFARLRIIL